VYPIAFKMQFEFPCQAPEPGLSPPSISCYSKENIPYHLDEMFMGEIIHCEFTLKYFNQNKQTK
jgi:hypothetical protein